MSFSSLLTSLNRPPLVLATGLALAGGLPALPVGSLSLGLLQVSNLLAFGVNVAAVSAPGRLDGDQDEQMRQGTLNPSNNSKPDSTPLQSSHDVDDTAAAKAAKLRLRSLVLPAGWAFSIWGAIYLGEATFSVAQLSDGSGLTSTLPAVTPGFVAANLVQSLWCASFRESYNEGWKKFVSVAMLGGTAYSLSTIMPTVMSLQSSAVSWYFVPLVMHFGWTTAATLVNLNGSVAMDAPVKDSTLVALGHGSAVLATGLGIGLAALGIAPPAYGMTIAWALLAVGNNTKANKESDTLNNGAMVMKTLCFVGSAACAAVSAYCML
ncbi:hypothetical protein IV203_032382 [Nitzschia inconspicua]|uniref:Uncharacterized protein n=1 Tax=Nitzschia inconspicua TaxID=303405 RepID=A0A9K3K462_9STRA|nr:hypothetical protein IV203_020492 [Nitzschia inconspicua]KAG7344851.1 hypothetical protein IV203_032382 [Nitzschia inconspicua]